MKTSQRSIYYFTAAILVALVIVSLCLGGRIQSTVVVPNSTAAGVSRGPSYEEIVGDQQKRWGHGHTLSDPVPASDASSPR